MEGKNLIKGGQLVPDGGKSVKPVDIKYHVLVGKKNGIMMNEKQRQGKTEKARPWFIDHKFPLSKYRNKDSITRRMVVPSLAKLAILCRQTPDQKEGFMSSSLHEFMNNKGNEMNRRYHKSISKIFC